jgi:hypothetical protein
MQPPLVRDPLGYEQVRKFSDGKKITGLLMRHPRGGPALGLWFDPERAVAATGFGYFAFGAPNRKAPEEPGAAACEGSRRT